jgi:eukaryotic-like serine/threonine-protein kinase
MTAVDRFQEGQLVGRYRIVRLIGEGGMGAVYEAIHPGLKKRVAVKVLLPRIAESQEARVRFLREGEAASRINHPHVVSVFDVGEDGEAPYLVMEYLEGHTLDVFLGGRAALELAEATALFLPIMAAVSAGHECGVVHRDLKPQNIFLAQGRWGELIPKVLDFGVSKLIDHEGPPVTRTAAVLGTACYMSPEQARGARHVEARSDQFTLGLILYEMLTGRRAYRGENDLETLYNAAVVAIQPAQELRAGLPDEVYALLTRMLAVSPADRYPSLRDGARVLLPFACDKTRSALARDFDAPAVVAPASQQTEPAGTEPPLSRPGGDDAPAGGSAESPAVSAEANATTSVGLPPTAVFPLTVDRQEDTTLRHAAVQAKARARELARGRLVRPGARIAFAIGTAAVAFTAAMLWKGTRPAADEQAEPDPQVRASEPAAVVPPAPLRPVARPAPAESPVGAAALAKPAPRSSEPADRAAPFEIRAFPADAEIVLDGRQPLVGRLQIVLPLAGSSHEIRVSAPGYRAKTISFGGEQAPPAEIRLDRVSARVRGSGAKRAAGGQRAAPAKRGTNDAMIIK